MCCTETEVVAVLTTTDKESAAEDLAGRLVEERLAACVQYMPIRSAYRWKGKIERASEWLLVVKTQRALAAKLTARIRELHGYELPEIVEVPVVGGLKDYLDWVVSETGAERPDKGVCVHAASYEPDARGRFQAVLREADALYEGRGRLRSAYARLAARLDELGICYSLAGGYALILHGVRRFTEDIDVLLGAGSFDTVTKELVGRGYVSIPGAEKSIRDAETDVRIDFILSGGFPGDGKPKPVVFPDPASGGLEIDGVRVLDLKTLIELKLASGMTAPGRLQDLADVQRLIAARGLTGEFAAGLHPYVREKFVDLYGTVGSGAPASGGPT